MKKLFINFISIFIIFLEIFNTNLVFAQKIVCEVENKYGTSKLFLKKYDDDGLEGCYVWGYIFWQVDNLSDDEKRFLEQINGKSVNEDDSQYNQILRLANELRELNYLPLMTFDSPLIENMNMNMFEILRSLLENDQ